MQLSEMRTFLKELLTSEGSSSFWGDNTLNRILNSSQVWTGKQKPWRILMKAKSTTTTADQNYYDVPPDYLYSSIFFIKVNSIDYNWVDETVFRASDFNTAKSYTIHAKFFFLYPTPTESDLTIDMWFQRRPIKLTEDTDTTILQQELEEAIIQRALYLCLKRDKKTNPALEAKNDAMEIINDVWQTDRKNFRGNRNVGNMLDNFPNYSIHI